MKKKKGIIREYAEAIITALLLALIIRAFVIQAFKIPSGSMIPTLLVGDHILVTKFIYGTKIPFMDKKVLVFREPQRGDIVVFKFPKDRDRDFIKRVIGVGGDVVEGRDKTVYLNGKPLDEPYIQHTDNDVRSISMDVRDNFGPVYVPKGKLFVMGDNRDQSFDSRYWGFVDLNDVKGKAFIIYWSWDSERHLPRLGRTGRLVR